MKITHEVCLVGPTMARTMLDCMDKRQRPISGKHVDKIASDMAAERFMLSPDPIVQMENGKYANGQHRLLAIVKTGRTVSMVVSSGWPVSTYEIMDSGIRRKLQHRVTLPWLSGRNSVIGMVRVAATIPDWHMSKLSEQAVVAVAIAGENYFEPIAAMLTRHSRMVSAVGAALARASMNGVPLEMLARFADVFLQPQISDGPTESAAVLLNARALGGKYRGETQRATLYQVATRCVELFVEGATIKLIKGHERDIYPRPDWLIEACALSSEAA